MKKSLTCSTLAGTGRRCTCVRPTVHRAKMRTNSDPIQLPDAFNNRFLNSCKEKKINNFAAGQMKWKKGKCPQRNVASTTSISNSREQLMMRMLRRTRTQKWLSLLDREIPGAETNGVRSSTAAAALAKSKFVAAAVRALRMDYRERESRPIGKWISSEEESRCRAKVHYPRTIICGLLRKA